MPVMDRMQQSPGPMMQNQGPAGAPPVQQPPPEAGQPTPDAGGDPQKQAIEEFLDQAYQVMYANGEANPQIIASLREPTNPEEAVEALSSTAAVVTRRVAEAGVKSGRQMDGPGVVLPVTIRLVQDLGGMAEAEGVYDFSPDEMNTALMLSMEKMFNATQDLGIWSKEQLQQGLKELMQANKTGKLDELVQRFGSGGEGDDIAELKEFGAAAAGAGQAPPGVAPPPGAM